MYLSAMADAAGVANPLVSAVKNSYTSAVALGAGEDFVPMLADHIASMNGIKLPS
jgi:3-hydroxyisobutyrate dehydrogenase-like beta-hydroxyacid dehydrogenase